MPNNSKPTKRKYTTITIPTPLFENIKESIKNTGFSSVSDYATYVLRETAVELSQNKHKAKTSEQSDNKIMEKLRALGYIS